MSTKTQAKPAQRGDEVTLEIEKFADQGKGLARHASGLVVFVPQAVPGDRVRAKVTKRAKSHAEAKLIDLLEPSEKRTEPRCFYFGTCGGCDWQHVEYAEQARMKQQSVREALVYQGGMEEDEVENALRPILEAEQPYFYRNRMVFDFSTHRWLTPDEIATGEDFGTGPDDGGFALGLHVPGSPHKVLDLQECHLQSRLSRQLVNGVRGVAKENSWAPWDIRRREGFLRHLTIREGKRTPGVLPRSASGRTGEVMVCLVTSRHDAERMERLAAFLQQEAPEVTTFVNIATGTPSQKKAQSGHSGEQHVLFGEGVIHEELGGLTFEIGPGTFFQTNTRQAERLFEATRAMADLRPTDRLYDLYCGVGALSLFMADGAGEVIGIEGAEASVKAARRNAEAGGIGNARFFGGGALRELFTEAFAAEHGRPDVLVADPPRAGMHKAVVRQIAALRPERFVYVSCNPQTQARDLGRLREATGGAYRVEAVQPVDMFPQTAHVENVVALKIEDR